MDLGQLVAQEVVNGFSQFKPDALEFDGENVLLIYRTLRALSELSEIRFCSRGGNYVIDVDGLSKCLKQKKRKNKEEGGNFRSYYGEDIYIKDDSLFVSNLPLNAHRDTIYRKIAITSKRNAIKVIPYRERGKKLVALEAIYVLFSQHKDDCVFQSKSSEKLTASLPSTLSKSD